MARPTFRSITLISSPYHVGIPGVGVAHGPDYLKQDGILESLQQVGIPVNEVELASVENDFSGDIARSFELIRRTSEHVREAHEEQSFPIVLAGNCSASVGVAAGLSHAVEQLGEELACVWFDAHDDFNTPDSLTSGYFDSMPIAMMAGQCFRAMVRSVPGFEPFDLRRLVHVGMRDVNEVERGRVEQAELSVVWGSTEKLVDFEGGLAAYLGEKGLERQPTLVHVDVDCLDTSIGRANQFAAPGGLLGDDLTGCLSRAASTTTPMALTIASFDPRFEGAEKLSGAVIEAVVAFLESLRDLGDLKWPRY